MTGTVVLAEDDPAMCELLELATRRAGRYAIRCSSGAQLLAQLEQSRDLRALPSLVVSDNRMPGMAGIDVAHRVRDWSWSVPFLLVTAFPDDALRAEAARAGVCEVLSKPVSVAELVEAIRRHARTPPCPDCGAPRTAARCEECDPTNPRGLGLPDALMVDLGGSD